MAKSNSKISLSHLLFYVAGLLLVVQYLLANMPSPSSDLLSFIVKLFMAIVIVGFYCYFIFGAKGCSSTIKALAPCILLIFLCGKYSITFGNANVDKYLLGVSEMAWLLLIACGFVYLFVHSKIIGVVFTWSTITYVGFISVSYSVMAIINAVNGKGFNLSSFISVVMLICAYACIGVGSFYISRSQSW